jgi:predicted MPP superfamily phosphohydrolase
VRPRFLRARGRGRDYSAGRAVWEWALRIAYLGDWPARIAGPLTQAGDPLVVGRAAVLPAGARAMRIVFASDLHIGPTTSAALLDRTFDLIRQQRPDVVLLGGDFVFLDATRPRLDRLRELVSSLPCPTFAVLGNHDLWAEDEAIVRTLHEAGATVLINRTVPLSDHVDLVGLDDPWSGQCDVDRALSSARAGRFRIVMCHNPDGVLHLGDAPFDLFLAGHTHGGHLATPLGPVHLPSGHLCRELHAGFYTRGSGLIFVSRGVGHVEPPFRVWAPSDILVLDLVPAVRRE